MKISGRFGLIVGQPNLKDSFIEEKIQNFNDNLEAERQVRLGIIGAGNAYRDLVRPALKALPGNEVVWVAGLERKETVDIPDKKRYLRIAPGEMERLPFDKVDAVMDLTPHEFHTNNLKVIFEAGKAAYVEKPFAISTEQIDATAGLLSAHPEQLAFFVTYYRDEKGLPLRALTGEITRNSWYAQFLNPMDGRLLRVLDSLGDIELVVGTCLEGPIYGSIKGREGLCDPKTGGMALDLGDHVFSYITLLRDRLGPVTIDSATAGVSIEAREHYARVTGNTECAEMCADIRLRGGGGAAMRFAIGKYTGVDEWAFYIQAKHGYVYMNLDSKINTMEIRSPAFSGVVAVVKPAPVKYTIVMSDLLRRIKDPSLQCAYGFENASETLRLILKIRERFNQKPRFEFETGHIPGLEEVRRVYAPGNGVGGRLFK